MKIPLEPIPKELVVPAGQSHAAKAAASESANYMAGSGIAGRLRPYPGQLDKAYPWLLGGSIALSVALCWLYVTKPVIVDGDGLSGADVASQAMRAASGTDKAGGHGSGRAAALVPSDTALPGAHKLATRGRDRSMQEQDGSAARSPRKISPAQLAKSGAGADDSPLSLGWEATNLKVQHILSVDSGSADLEKIVLNVPVLYETRTMRWTAGDIAKARAVLRRLTEYERNLNKLRNEGHAILQDWNQLLETTAPTVALRADSPSLPYNHGQGSESETLPGSAAAIKLEH